MRIVRALVCAFLVVVLARPLAAGAADTTWTLPADTSRGTTVNTSNVATGLTLDGVSGEPIDATTQAWFDPAWEHRLCVEIENPNATPLSDHPVPVTIDTAALIAAGLLQADGAELRAVDDSGAVLEHWVQGLMDAADTVIWLRAATLAPGANTICFYVDNATAPSVDVGASVVDWPNPVPVYVTVDPGHVGADTAVASYVAGNTITDGTTTLTLAANQVGTLPGATHDEATLVWATGPISLRGQGLGLDTLAPLSWADTEFVLPTNRASQTYSVYSPFGDVTVDGFVGGAATPSVDDLAVAQGTSVSFTLTPDPAGGNGAIVTATGPVLVTHHGLRGGGDPRTDTFVSVPPTTDPLYGIRTRNLVAAQNAAGTITIDYSNGTNQAVTRTRGQILTSGDGAAFDGNTTSEAAAVTGDAPAAAIQQADRDGWESTVFLPASELSSTYVLPTAADYVAMSCPTAAMITVGAAAPIPCTPSGAAPGKADARAPVVLAAGTTITSDGAPFYVMYEPTDSQDETNVLGAAQGAGSLATPPIVTLGILQTIHVPTGTWTSEVVDATTAAAWDSLTWDATVPAGATLTFQAASAASPTGPFTFVGPDGTAATFYSSPGDLPADLDGDQYVQLIATFTRGADPQEAPLLRSVGVTCTLPGSITGVVFQDSDPADDTLNPSEAGVGGVTVQLLDSAGTVVATTTTAADGSYSFADLAPGPYQVMVDPATIGTLTTSGPRPITVVEASTVEANVGLRLPPPASDPPVTDPPAGEPPATDPPASDPPADEEQLPITGSSARSLVAGGAIFINLGLIALVLGRLGNPRITNAL